MPTKTSKTASKGSQVSPITTSSPTSGQFLAVDNVTNLNQFVQQTTRITPPDPDDSSFTKVQIFVKVASGPSLWTNAILPATSQWNQLSNHTCKTIKAYTPHNL